MSFGEFFELNFTYGISMPRQNKRAEYLYKNSLLSLQYLSIDDLSQFKIKWTRL